MLNFPEAMNRLFFLWVCCSLCMLTGCSRQLDVPEYIGFVQDNGLFNKSKQIGQFVLKTTWYPADYLALSELKNTPPDQLTGEMVSNQSEMFEDAVYIRFTISREDGENVMKYGVTTREMYVSRQMYMENHMNDHLTMLCGRKEYRPLLVTLQRSYGMSPDVVFMVVFPRPQPEEGAGNRLIITYSDPYYGLGATSFEYDAADLIEYKSRLRI